MGFSLVGNSGDQSTTNNIYETDYSASINPQFDQEGSGAGSVALDLAPTVLGGSIGTYSPAFSNSYQPINIVNTGAVTGDSALSALQGLQSGQVSQSEASGDATTGTTSTGTTLSDLLGTNGIYYVLGAIVLFFLAHHKG